MDWFLVGYTARTPDPWELYYLADLNRRERQLDALNKATHVIMIFPLYTDSMPGIVKQFFEQMILRPGRSSLKVGFIVQSGFPESIHSEYVARYLEKFVGRLGMQYLGTVIKGGVEGIQARPPFMSKALYRKFNRLGAHFADHQSFEPELLRQMRRPRRLSPMGRGMIVFFNYIGLTNFYWNSRLKKHDAYSSRFDQPYLSSERK